MKVFIQFSAVVFFGIASVSSAQGIDPVKAIELNKLQLDQQVTELKINTLKQDVKFKDAFLVPSLEFQYQELNRLNAESAKNNASLEQTQKNYDELIAELIRLSKAYSALDTTGGNSSVKP